MSNKVLKCYDVVLEIAPLGARVLRNNGPRRNKQAVSMHCRLKACKLIYLSKFGKLE